MVSTTGIAVSSKTELRFPITGPGGHGRQIIHQLVDQVECFSGKVNLDLLAYNSIEMQLFRIVLTPLCIQVAELAVGIKLLIFCVATVLVAAPQEDERHVLTGA